MRYQEKEEHENTKNSNGTILIYQPAQELFKCIHRQLVSHSAILGVVGIEEISVVVCVMLWVIVGMRKPPSIPDVEDTGLLLAPSYINQEDSRESTSSSIGQALTLEIDLRGAQLFGNITLASSRDADHDLRELDLLRMKDTITSFEPTSTSAIFPSGDILEDVNPGMS